MLSAPESPHKARVVRYINDESLSLSLPFPPSFGTYHL